MVFCEPCIIVEVVLASTAIQYSQKCGKFEKGDNPETLAARIIRLLPSQINHYNQVRKTFSLLMRARHRHVLAQSQVMSAVVCTRVQVHSSDFTHRRTKPFHPRLMNWYHIRLRRISHRFKLPPLHREK